LKQQQRYHIASKRIVF